MVTIRTSHIPGFINEAGGHRVQRVPGNEKRGRVHSSTVTVSVLDEARASTIYDKRTEDDFSYRWFSGTGKGGQHRNKHQNCLELTHIPSSIKVTAQGRSRESNERDCMSALLSKLDEGRDGTGAQVINSIRSNQIGSGMRGDKIRTYRFQDDRVSDHRSGKQASCKAVMRGNLEKLWT
jgi:peptide chain release factor 1